MTRGSSWLTIAVVAVVMLTFGVAYLANIETVPASVSASLLRDRCICAIEERARGEGLQDTTVLASLGPCEGVEVVALDGESMIVRATWLDWSSLTVREVSSRVDLPVARIRTSEVCRRLLR